MLPGCDRDLHGEWKTQLSFSHIEASKTLERLGSTLGTEQDYKHLSGIYFRLNGENLEMPVTTGHIWVTIVAYMHVFSL